MNMFDEIKEKILLRNFVQGEKSIKGKRIHVEPCPLCGGHDCFDILLPGKGGNTHETFKCFQCNQSGSIIDFYCLINNLNPKNKEDVSKAINNLCNDYGINNNIKGQKQTGKASQSLTEPHKAIKENKKEYDFTDLANKLHENLINNEDAKQYFIDRGLSEDIIKEFKLGFAANGVNDAFKDYPEFKQKYEPLAECYRFFIPMFDDKGKCNYILSRIDNTLLELKIKNAELHKNDRQGKENKYPKTMNLKGVPTTIYNLDQAMESEIIYICEGWCDALSIEESGYKAVALNSVSSVNLLIKKLQEYKNYQSKFYVIALDNDEAGCKARKELESKLLELKCKVKHLYIEGSGSKDVNDLLINAKEILYEKIFSIEDSIEKDKEELLLKNSCYNYLDTILNQFISNKDKKIPSTGYKCLDETLGGGLYNSLYVVGGITGLGKTSIVLNIVENLAAAGEDILFISLEMSRAELVAKSLARYVRELTDTRYKKAKYLSQRDIQSGKFDINDSDFQKALLKYKELSKNLFIQEANFNYNTEKIREDIINHRLLRGKAPVVVVDYLQVLPCLKDYIDDKKNIDFNITELKRISREYDTPVIAISSINREYYKKPIDFNAFKSSGNIEFTADVVIGLQYSFMQDVGCGKESEKEAIEKYKEEKIKNPRAVQTVILKNRNGSIGNSTNFQYEPQYNYFEEV